MINRSEAIFTEEEAIEEQVIVIRAFDSDGKMVAESFPENEEAAERMMLNLSEQYFKVERVKPN